MLVVVAQREPDVQEPKLADLHTVGVEMVVGRILRMPDGTTNILGQGRRRVERTFTLARMLDRTEAVYRSVLAGVPVAEGRAKETPATPCGAAGVAGTLD